MWEAWPWAEWDVRKKLIALPPLSAGNLHGDLWIVRSAPLWNRHGNRVSQRAAEFEIYICAIVAHRVTVDSATVTRDSPSVKINLPSCSAYLLTDT